MKWSSVSAGLTLALLGCASVKPSAPVSAPTALPPRVTPPAPATPPVKLDVAGARYVPSESFRALDDGRLAAVYAGRRLLVKNGEASVVDSTPIEDLGRPHRIPDALGGGYLFVRERSVWFSKDYEGALTRVALLTDKPDELRVGVGRNRVLVGNTLYELPSAKAVALEPAGMVELFGTSKGELAAVDAKGALWVSMAAGASWKKLTAPRVQRLAYDGKGIVAYTDKGDLRLGADGKLAPRPNEPGMVVASNVDAFDESFMDLSKPPPAPGDAERLLGGLVRSMNDTTVIGIDESDLLFLNAASGTIEKTVAGAFKGHRNCFVIRGGSPSFVGCNEDEFRLFRLDGAGSAPVLERSIKGIYTQDFGEPGPEAPLAFAKKCDGSELKGAACIRQPNGEWKDLAPPADPAGLLANVPFFVHVAASKDGRVFSFGWRDGGGDLVIVDSGAKKVRSISKSAMPAWAGGGVDWHALSIESGTLRFLISSRHAKAGIVEIRPDDSIHAERLDGVMSAEGPRALRLGTDGKLWETLDAGHTFHEVAPPPGGAPHPGRELFACRETGCTLGPWYRVGWGGGAAGR